MRTLLPWDVVVTHHADIIALGCGRHRGDRRAEIRDVKAATQHVGQAGIGKIDHDVLSLLLDVDRDLIVWQIDDDAPFSADSAPEIDIAQIRFHVDGRLGVDRQTGSVDRRRRSARTVDGHDDRIALDRSRIVQGTYKIEYQTGPTACLYHVDVAHVSQADILGRLARVIRGAGEIQCDSRRIGHRKPDGRFADRIFQRHFYDDVRALLICRDRLNRIFLGHRQAGRQHDRDHDALPEHVAHACIPIQRLVFLRNHYFVS
jgi:hypothetical protein